jgi:hypothetical protein
MAFLLLFWVLSLFGFLQISAAEIKLFYFNKYFLNPSPPSPLHLHISLLFFFLPCLFFPLFIPSFYSSSFPFQFYRVNVYLSLYLVFIGLIEPFFYFRSVRPGSYCLAATPPYLDGLAGQRPEPPRRRPGRRGGQIWRRWRQYQLQQRRGKYRLPPQR